MCREQNGHVIGWELLPGPKSSGSWAANFLNDSRGSFGVVEVDLCKTGPKSSSSPSLHPYSERGEVPWALIVLEDVAQRSRYSPGVLRQRVLAVPDSLV